MSPTSFGMPLLAPTPGRIGENQNGYFDYRGRTYIIKPARHGMARHCQWEVLSQSADTIECSTEIRSETNDCLFPFNLLATHRVTLASRTLRSLVKLQNIGNNLMPANVGWHPYLHLPEECTVYLPANSY